MWLGDDVNGGLVKLRLKPVEQGHALRALSQLTLAFDQSICNPGVRDSIYFPYSLLVLLTLEALN